MNADELKALRMPVGILLATLAVAAGAVYYTDLLVKRAGAELSRQKADFQTAQNRMRQSGGEKDTIVQYVDKYRALEKAGFAGEEQRINWLDALRNANQRADLFGVSYQIGIQHDYPHAAEFDPGPVQLQESSMELNMRLMHEEDLMRFFDQLRAQQAGLFHIRGCALVRTDRSDTLRNQANITAKCELSWLTARPGGAATGAKR